MGLQPEASVDAGGMLGSSGLDAFEMFGVGGGGELGDLASGGGLTLELALFGSSVLIPVVLGGTGSGLELWDGLGGGSAGRSPSRIETSHSRSAQGGWSHLGGGHVVEPPLGDLADRGVRVGAEGPGGRRGRPGRRIPDRGAGGNRTPVR